MAIELLDSVPDFAAIGEHVGSKGKATEILGKSWVLD